MRVILEAGVLLFLVFLMWSFDFWWMEWRLEKLDKNYILVKYKYYVPGSGIFYFNRNVGELREALREKGIFLQDNPHSPYNTVGYHDKPELYIRWENKRTSLTIALQTWRILQNFMEIKW